MVTPQHCLRAMSCLVRFIGRSLFVRAGLFAIASALALAAHPRNDGPLQLVQTISLPEIDGRIDHFSIDVKGNRAFLAALAKNTGRSSALPSRRACFMCPSSTSSSSRPARMAQ